VGEIVRVDASDGVATITLDSQHNRNALSRQLLAQLHDALDAAERQRVIVLTHAGPAFCSGADLRERAEGAVDSTPMASLMDRLMHGPVPTIAACHGAVRAGGVGVMAACDLVVVHPEVTFAFTEVRIGVAPAIISVPILSRCAWSQLAAPFLTGAAFSAAEALRIGLVSHVSDDVAHTAAALATAICGGGPSAIASTKQLLRHPLDLTAAQRLSEALFSSAEAAEGMAAFAEQRAPVWSVR
jgi:enoyl-CoA hydratase/carnithine racemase